MEALSILPQGIFGRAYIAWLERCGTTSDVRAPVRWTDDSELTYVMQRYRECHDLYHCITSMSIVPTLHKRCNQKPKFQNFELCGKNCASTWQLVHGGSNGNPSPSVGNLTGGNLPGKLLAQIPQPFQAHIQTILPGLASALQQPGQNQPQQQQQQPPTNVNLNMNNVPPVPPSSIPQQSTMPTTLAPKNPNENLTHQKNVNLTANGGSGPGFLASQSVRNPANGVNETQIPTPVTITPNTCRLAGCTKPFYTDQNFNHPSEYCSKRHREKTVITNQAEACIMCSKMPRASADHFCSKACRDAALSPWTK